MIVKTIKKERVFLRLRERAVGETTLSAWQLTNNHLSTSLLTMEKTQ